LNGVGLGSNLFEKGEKKLKLFQNLKQLTIFMKEPMGLVGDYLNSLILLRTVVTYQNWLFDFSRTTNLKNHSDNHQGLILNVGRFFES
jgi:7,8-dihydro-6-hydroxymethylpterin-pyrophosphokinase